MRVARKPIRSFEFRVIARRRDVEPRCYKLEPASTKQAHIRRVCTSLYFSTILTLSLPLSLSYPLCFSSFAAILSTILAVTTPNQAFCTATCAPHKSKTRVIREQGAAFCYGQRPPARRNKREQNDASRVNWDRRGNTTRGIKRYRVEEGEHVLLKRERTECWDCVKRMTAARLETEW